MIGLQQSRLNMKNQQLQTSKNDRANLAAAPQIDGLIARPLIAHVDSRDQKRIEPLPEHLLAVQKEAHRFGSVFGCGETARFLGSIHDLGKASTGVQDYLWAAAGDCSEEDEPREQNVKS